MTSREREQQRRRTGENDACMKFTFAFLGGKGDIGSVGQRGKKKGDNSHFTKFGCGWLKLVSLWG